MMDKAYFVGKGEILDLFNSHLQVSVVAHTSVTPYVFSAATRQD